MLLSLPKAYIRHKQHSQNRSRNHLFVYMEKAEPVHCSQLASNLGKPGGLNPCWRLLHHFPYRFATLASILLNIYTFENPARLIRDLWLALMFVVREKLYAKSTEKTIFN